MQRESLWFRLKVPESTPRSYGEEGSKEAGRRKRKRAGGSVLCALGHAQEADPFGFPQDTLDRVGWSQELNKWVNSSEAAGLLAEDGTCSQTHPEQGQSVTLRVQVEAPVFYA